METLTQETIQNAFFRALAFLKHQLTAWHTRGEGIHSPYLFELVEKILYDDNAYYCWRNIEKQRDAMTHSTQSIIATDYGTGAGGQKKISLIAKRELESPKIGQLIFRITEWLSHNSSKPLNIIELGTSLGITTAYLAMADKRNIITTYEGSIETAKAAQKNWEKLGIKNIRLISGNIDDTLFPTSPTQDDQKPVDIAYLDANHTYEATLRYFNKLGTRAHEKSIFILDDIHHSPQMQQAWQAICHHEEVTTTMDLYHIGLVFFDKHYIRRNYKLRI